MIDDNDPKNGTEDYDSKEWVVNTLHMNDYDHYIEYKEHAINGMMIFGDKFVEALGIALSEADDKQAVKIMRLFGNECATHEMLHRMHVAKNIAMDIEQQKQDTALMSHEL
jgi:hypothetical protein